MKVVVVGGGKVGFYLARTLMDHGHQPSIIERNKKLCLQIANQLDLPVICDDGSSLEALESAGTGSADALVSVTGTDEDNLVICQLAKRRFNVPRTAAQVNNPKNAGIMKQLGVDIPVSATDSIARIIEREVDASAIRQLLSLNRGEASLIEFQLPERYQYQGKTLMEMPLPSDSVVVSITRDGTLIIPRGNVRLMGGDKMIVIAKDTVIHELSQALGLSAD